MPSHAYSALLADLSRIGGTDMPVEDCGLLSFESASGQPFFASPGEQGEYLTLSAALGKPRTEWTDCQLDALASNSGVWYGQTGCAIGLVPKAGELVVSRRDRLALLSGEHFLTIADAFVNVADRWRSWLHHRRATEEFYLPELPPASDVSHETSSAFAQAKATLLEDSALVPAVVDHGDRVCLELCDGVDVDVEPTAAGLLIRSHHAADENTPKNRLETLHANLPFDVHSFCFSWWDGEQARRVVGLQHSSYRFNSLDFLEAVTTFVNDVLRRRAGPEYHALHSSADPGHGALGLRV